MLRTLLRIGSCILATVLCLGEASARPPPFTPPNERYAIADEARWPANAVLALAYHDVADRQPDQRFLAIRTERLIEQLSWLRENGYTAVSVEALLMARSGGEPLPPKAVLLSFDDGYLSFYDRVFPILKAFEWPAVFAPVGIWMDTPPAGQVPFGDEKISRDAFVTWDQVRELAASGLIEIASHSYDLHRGTIANPQDSSLPAAAVQKFDPASGAYETPEAYRDRLAADARRIAERLERETGKRPRVWVWPYGAYSGTGLTVVVAAGFETTLTLDDGLSTVAGLAALPRMLVGGDPSTSEFVGAVSSRAQSSGMRALYVDLDDIYDADPAEADRRLGDVVQRIADAQINTVFLRAFRDPGDGCPVRETYFPNRHLPMRADLFGRVAWQLRSRAGVRIYAQLPILGFDTDPWRADVRTTSAGGTPSSCAAPRSWRADDDARRRIGDIYEDLARSAIFDGVLFEDEADGPSFSPTALNQRDRAEPSALSLFAAELAARVRAVRGDQVRTARSVYVDHADALRAPALARLLDSYDWIVPTAAFTGDELRRGDVRLVLQLAADLARRPEVLKRTLFVLRLREPQPSSRDHADAAAIAGVLQHIERAGGQNFGVDSGAWALRPDIMKIIRPALSLAWFPFQ